MNGRLVATAAVCVMAGAALASEPPELDPAKELDKAEPMTLYRWTAKASGQQPDEVGGDRLRYTWRLPKGFSKEVPRNLIFLVHGDEEDYRWGHKNYPPETFRPEDITISVDGVTARGDGTRVFLPRMQDAVSFRDFVLEVSRSLPTARIIVYGHGMGGMFATVFAGQFARTIDGVVAHGSGAYGQAAVRGAVTGLPMVFVHGAADETVPLGQSIDARDAYAEAGCKLVVLRRLPGVDDRATPTRASECIDYCIAMTASKPGDVLEAVRRMLTPKAPDGAGDLTTPPLAMARAALRRFDDRAGEKIPAPLKDVTKEERQAAWDVAVAIESLGLKVVGAMQQRIATPEALRAAAAVGAEGVAADRAERLRKAAELLWQLASLREEFRGVDGVETYIKQIELDALLKEHMEAAEEWLEGWFADPPPKDAFAAAIEALPKCYLYESMPPDFEATMRKWAGRAAELKIPPELAEQLPLVKARSKGYAEGIRAFGVLVEGWQLP